MSYPALVDRGETVAIALCDYPGEARLSHRLGVLRLLRLGGGQQVKYLRKQMLRGNEFNLVLAGAGQARAPLLDDLIDGAYVQAMSLDRDLPRSEQAYKGMLERGRGELVSRGNEIETIVLNFLRVLAEVRHKLAALDKGKWLDSRADIEQQLERLLVAGFQRDTPGEWLAQYPRYIKALRVRVERLSGQYAKDQKCANLLQDLALPLWEQVQQRPGLLLVCAEAAQYRWMLEEFRVSLFAQNLGTKQAVSEKRLQEQWRAVRHWLDGNPH